MINLSVIGEDQLPLGIKCNLNLLLDVAINPCYREGCYLLLEAKYHCNPLWDVVINSSFIEDKFHLGT